MALKYDSKTINKVLETYDTLKEYKDPKNKDYSLTCIKQAISKEYGLKISDVDKILYGNRLKADRLNDVEKNWVANIYQNYNEISLSKIAKSLSRNDRKISTDYLYKVLYEMDNKGYDIKWRGAPEPLKSKTIENIVEDTTISPEKKPREYSDKFWKGAQLGAIAASIAVGAILYYPVKMLIDEYFAPIINAQQIQIKSNDEFPYVPQSESISDSKIFEQTLSSVSP